MENKFYKVFCCAMGFGALAMVLLTLVFLCGNISFSAEGIKILKSCIIMAGLVVVATMILMNRNYKNEALKAAKEEVEKKQQGKKADAVDETPENLKKQLSEKQKELDKARIQLDAIRHEERMALIKQLGEGAPNDVIEKLLESLK